MDKSTLWFLGYVWFLSLIASIFFGHEIARIVHKMDKDLLNAKQNDKIHHCHKVIMGEI